MFYSGEKYLKKKSANLQPEFAVDPQIIYAILVFLL